MYRAKVAASIAALVFFILVLGVTSFWGTERLEYFYKRSQSAYLTEGAYLQLAIYTDRYFNDQLDEILLWGEIRKEETQQREGDLFQALTAVREAVATEIHLVEPDEQEEELDELKVVGELERLINQGIQMTEQARASKLSGNTERAREIAQEIFDQLLERKFWPLVDEAIADERGEIEATSHREANVINNVYRVTVVLTLLSVMLGVCVAVLLYRSLKRPLDQLILGTKKVSQGELEHRILLHGADEFSLLARHFNSMAISLERQQQALLQGRTVLAKEVDVRTAELRQANEKLQRIDVIRRRFFADISHELRTPMTIIRGEAEVTLRGENRSAEEYRMALRRIVDLTGQLTNLVNDLLFLARSETQSARYESELVDLNSLLDECGQDAQHLAREHKLNVMIVNDPQTLTVRGDSARLKQLLHILIDNACRYSRDGESITLSLASHEQNALITVTDTGLGIAEDELEFIFERFYRSENARLVAQGGAGLGLNMAKSITEAHHGTIELTSQIGEGTTVQVALPLLSQDTEVEVK